MRRFHPHDSRIDHPNVVPLVDVMLCLIVFYMLAAKIGVATGADPDIVVPDTRIGNALDLTGTLTLNVREGADGEPLVSALIDELGRDRVSLDMRTLDASSRTPLDNTLRSLRAGHPDMKIVLRTDENVHYKAFIKVLLAVNGANIKHIYHNMKEPVKG